MLNPKAWINLKQGARKKCPVGHVLRLWVLAWIAHKPGPRETRHLNGYLDRC